jgi:beta-lactamase class A
VLRVLNRPMNRRTGLALAGSLVGIAGVTALDAKRGELAGNASGAVASAAGLTGGDLVAAGLSGSRSFAADEANEDGESVMTTGWERVEEIAGGLTAGRRISVAAHRLGDGRTWQFDDHLVVPAASTIKTPILVAVYRAVDAGHLSLDEPQRIDAADRVIGSGVLNWMSPDLLLTLRDHAYLMIAISDNTASNVMLSAAGMDAVRDVIGDLGMTDTQLNRRFLGRTPRPEEGENYTSAADLTVLMTAIASDRAASPAACAEMRATLELQQDRALLARSLPDDVQYGGKSGLLTGIRHDSGILTGPKGTLAAAVVTTGFSDLYEAEMVIGEVGAALVEAAGISG